MARCAVAVLPFVAEDAPCLGAEALAASLRRAGHEVEVRYLNLELAAEIGRAAYGAVDRRPDLLLGEWLFARALFGAAAPPGAAYVEELLAPAHARGDLSAELLVGLPNLRRTCEDWLDARLESEDWGRYDVVGFSSSFQQNAASLALAERIRARWPRTALVLGGANAEGEMGEEILASFPFLDAVVSGEADAAGPVLIEDLAAGRRGGFRAGAPVEPLDDLPIPDFDGYFKALAASRIDLDPTAARLPIETGRGCWWGEKHHCVFCGLNGSTMAFRRKTAPRAMEEFRLLAARYPTRRVWAADNILDPRAFGDLLPALAAAGLGLEIFYEVKSNLTRAQIELLARAGVRRIQPGIESLSTPTLDRMKKGVRAYQNVQTLKWATRFGIDLDWNLLCGFPGEDPAQYRAQADLVAALEHLPPPHGLFPAAVHRFAPLARDAAAAGRLRAAPAYRHVYPFPEARLARLAYFFASDPPRDLADYARPLAEEVAAWRAPRGNGDLAMRDDGARILIRDTRRRAVVGEGELRGPARDLYLACDAAASRRSLLERLAPLSEEELDRLLAPLLARRWMLRLDDRYLALAIPDHAGG